MRTELIKGKVERVWTRRGLVLISLDDGSRKLIHRDELVRGNRYLGEMAWEDMLQDKIVKFWARQTDKIKTRISPDRLDDKVDYWRAEAAYLISTESGDALSKGEAARSNYSKVKAKELPTIESFEQVLRVCISMGRYDVAFSLVKALYASTSTPFTSRNVAFRKYPGPSGVMFTFSTNRGPKTKPLHRAVTAPGLAGEVVYTWWALHGGWHHKGRLYEPFDLNRVVSAVNNPFVRAGVEWFSLKELRQINRGSGAIVLQPGGLTKDHLGSSRYWINGDVVYVKDGAKMLPLGIKHPDLVGKPTSRRAFDAAWVGKWCDKLNLSRKLTSVLTSYAAVD